MPVYINPDRPADLGTFARLYNQPGMTPQEVQSDLFLNAPTSGKSFLDDQWRRTAPGSKGLDPVTFFNSLKPKAALPQYDSGPMTPFVKDRLSGEMAMPPLTGGVTRDKFAMLQKSRGGAVLEDIMTSLMPETDRIAWQNSLGQPNRPALRPITSTELESHPKFRELYQADPARAEAVYQASTGVSLRGTLKARAAQEVRANTAAASTVQGLLNRGDIKWKNGIPQVRTGKDELQRDIWETPTGPMLQMIQRGVSANSRTGRNQLGVTAPETTDQAKQALALMARTGKSYEEIRPLLEAQTRAGGGAGTVATLQTPPSGTRGERAAEIRRSIPAWALNRLAEVHDTADNTLRSAANLGVSSLNNLMDIGETVGGFLGLPTAPDRLSGIPMQYGRRY